MRSVLPPELAEAFLRLRALEEGNADPAVPLSDLRSLEAALGWALPDAVVTLLAARPAYLERQWNLIPGKVVATHAAGRVVVPPGLCPFAVARGRKTWLCFRGGLDDARLYHFVDKGRDSAGPFEPVEWLTRELGHARELVRRRWLGGDERAGALLRAERSLAADAFTPLVVEAVTSVARVRHAKFGLGVVLAEEGSGGSRKLTVEFADGTRRVFDARFLEPV